MSRIALYRKYRSADFGDVVGQQHVTRTLEAAVQRGLMSHAYLLTGPRGTGKTSIARILARRINELPVEADLGRELDIIEIDAASNRGIDEMRSLREKIMSAPTHLKYKVYIIDEVHMLTKEAFNALLKTLEEPPAHAIFVLATTEAHKLPETIISRTQRFDLHPIGEADLVARLGEIAKLENIDIDAAALSMIAHASRGGFRDAISLLDQLSALDEKIGVEHVSAMLGMAAREDIDALLSAAAQHDTTKVFERLERMVALGNDPQGLTRQLLDALRADLLAQVGAKPAKSQFGMELSQLTLAIQRLTQALANFKITGHYSLPLELALYELCQPLGAATAATQPPAVTQATQTTEKPASTATPTSSATPTATKQPVKSKNDQRLR